MRSPSKNHTLPLDFIGVNVITKYKQGGLYVREMVEKGSYTNHRFSF